MILRVSEFYDLPKRHFGAILADPPWRFETYNENGRGRCPDWKPFKWSPSIHYDTIGSNDVAAMPVESLARDDACLFMWISWPMLEDALAIMSAWGFKYKTCGFAWLKADVSTINMFDGPVGVQIGTGYWTRSNSEVCLLATRGKPKRLNADVRQGIIAPRREHSRKPDGIHERIERLVAGPYLELFARQRRPGWTVWGNETEKFKATA
ncbi:MAG: MT-A70 family methyltransferase [Sulfuricaulis sp.]|nr:MT-A70 family methyltransferase [Sulfuricaulis sp.]